MRISSPSLPQKIAVVLWLCAVGVGVLHYRMNRNASAAADANTLADDVHATEQGHASVPRKGAPRNVDTPQPRPVQNPSATTARDPRDPEPVPFDQAAPWIEKDIQAYLAESGHEFFPQQPQWERVEFSEVNVEWWNDRYRVRGRFTVEFAGRTDEEFTVEALYDADLSALIVESIKTLPQQRSLRQ